MRGEQRCGGPHLVPNQAIAGGALLATRHGAIVEVVLLAHVAAGPHEAGPTLAAPVILTLTR